MPNKQIVAGKDM